VSINRFWIGLLAAGVLSACGGSAPAVSPSAAAKPASAPASAAASAAASPKPSTSAAASSAPSAKPAASGAAAGDWNQVVAAAKQEGQVVVMGQGGNNVVDALTAGFKKAYPDIKIDYTGATGPEIANKLLTERQAGRFTVDVVVHGTTTFITQLIPAGALDPLQSHLIGPNDRDPSKWREGYTFADDAGKYDFMLLVGVKVPLIYNPKAMSPSDLKSYKDLLDPKWKGKMAMFDPRSAGSGLASATFWYTTPSLGKDYLKEFFGKQGVVLTSDDRQLTDWVARGQYPIGVAAQDFSAIELKERGVPVEFLHADGLKEGTYVTAAWGSLGAVNKAPHPNAANLYIDWLMSKEGQEAMAKASGYPSRRLDASTAGLADAVIPKPGVEYQENAKEKYVVLRDEIVGYLKTVITG